MDSQSRSRLGYLKFVASRPRSLKFVASCSTSRLGYLSQALWLRGQDPGWDTSSLWLRAQDPGWDTSSLCLRGQGAGWDTSSFVASRDASSFVASWSGSRVAYLKFCGFAVEISLGLPQVCARGQDPGLGYSVVRIPVGIPQNLWLRGQDPVWLRLKIPVGIPQNLWLRGQDPGWGTSNLWLRDPGWDTSKL